MNPQNNSRIAPIDISIRLDPRKNDSRQIEFDPWRRIKGMIQVMRTSKGIHFFGVVYVCCILAIPSFSEQDHPPQNAPTAVELPNGIMARVGRLEITASRFEKMLDKAALPVKTPDAKMKMKNNLLNRLIIEKLKLNAAYDLHLEEDGTIVYNAQTLEKRLLLTQYIEQKVVYPLLSEKDKDVGFERDRIKKLSERKKIKEGDLLWKNLIDEVKQKHHFRFMDANIRMFLSILEKNSKIQPFHSNSLDEKEKEIRIAEWDTHHFDIGDLLYQYEERNMLPVIDQLVTNAKAFEIIKFDIEKYCLHQYLFINEAREMAMDKTPGIRAQVHDQIETMMLSIITRKEVFEKIGVTEDEMRKYYAAHKRDGLLKTSFEASRPVVESHIRETKMKQRENDWEQELRVKYPVYINRNFL